MNLIRDRCWNCRATSFVAVEDIYGAEVTCLTCARPAKKFTATAKEILEQYGVEPRASSRKLA